MQNTIIIALGIASAAVGLVRMVFYVYKIVQGHTKPERATWWIWSVLVLVLLAAQWSGGATWSLGLTIGQVISLTTIAVLSLKYGYGRFKLRDVLALVFAAIGLAAWWYTKNPLTAIVIMIAIDVSGHVLNYAKIREAPYSESLGTWLLAAVAPTLALLAAANTSLVVYVYPLYCTIFNWSFVTLLVWRRKLKKR